MNSKSELFKQLGWSSELIEHYLISDDETTNKTSETINLNDVYETSSVTIRYSISNDTEKIVFNKK